MQPANDTVSGSNRKQWFTKPCLILFAACIGWSLLTEFNLISIGPNLLPLIILVIAAAILSVFTLTRVLPVENSIAATVFVLTISSFMGMIGAKTGIPFGPIQYALGWKLFHLLPWYLPLIWLIFLIQSRGVARLILRPWRRANYYGFWMIGLTSLLTVLLDLIVEPFATRVHHLWFWNTTLPGWYDTPWVNFVGWFATGLVILACTSLWFINKKPMKQEPADYAPLLIWLVIALFLTAVNARHHFSEATALGLLLACVTCIAASLGGRRSY